MLAVQAPDRPGLEELAHRFEAAANEFPAVDAIVFFRPDKRDEELKREARRIFVPPPNPVAAEFDPALLKQLIDDVHRAGLLDRLSDGGIDAAFGENLRAAGIDAELFERLYSFDDNAERRRQFDGERAAEQAAMDWETLIPPNCRLLTDENGGEIWRYAVCGFQGGHWRHLWQFHLVGTILELKPDPRPRRFEMLAFEAHRLVVADAGRGDSPASSWLIYLADRAEPLRPSAWHKPDGFVRDQRTVLDYSPLHNGAPMWGRSASQPDKDGGRKLHDWWAARLSNVFWLSALAVSHAVEAAALSPPMDRNTGSPADAAGPVPSQAEPSSTAGTSRAVDGPAFATALIAEAIKNDGKLSDGAKLTAKELHRRLEKAGVTVARSGLYENSDYEGVRKLGKKLGLFVKLPEKRNQADAVRRGSKDKHKGQTETADHRELPPDQIAR